MLNGEKMKLRKKATISTSLITNTGKLSSLRSFFFAGGGVSARGCGALAGLSGAFSGVSVIVAVMWRGLASVKRRLHR